MNDACLLAVERVFGSSRPRRWPTWRRRARLTNAGDEPADIGPSHEKWQGRPGLVRIDGFVSLGVVGSAAFVALGAELADPIIGMVITIVILKITWNSWRTVSTGEPGDLRDLARPLGA